MYYYWYLNVNSNTYDKNHWEVQVLQRLAETNHSLNDRDLSDDDDEHEPVPMVKGQFSYEK